MLFVNPWHWLEEDGSFPSGPPRLRRNIVRVARLIEYGGSLEVGTARETLEPCGQRPGRQPCLGFLWVTKLPDQRILAFCDTCGVQQVCISDWQDTDWADGQPPPMRLAASR